jgi:protein-tyrosine phosphatase
MTELLSPASLVLPLPVEAWVERRDDDYLIHWTPDEPLVALYAGLDPNAIDFNAPLAAVIDAAGKVASVRWGDEERAKALDYERSRGRVFFALDFGRRSLITAERTLPLPGGVNFRDVGGYRTADGRAVRWGQVYRAGSLAELTDDDVATVGALGLRLACDLRSADEVARHADRLPPGATHAHRPIVGEVSRLRRVVTLYRKRHRVQELLEEVYRVMLDQNGPVFAEVLRLAADPANRPLIIHCTAGKDRTGLAVALLLLALGVPEETVVADYTLSNHAFDVLANRMRPEMARLYSLGFGEVQLQPFLLAEARTLRGALAYVQRRYGSVDWYLQRAGLSDDMVARLRDGLLTD